MVEDHLNWKVIFKKILLPTNDGENNETNETNDADSKQLDISGEHLNGLAIPSFENTKTVVDDDKSQKTVNFFVHKSREKKNDKSVAKEFYRKEKITFGNPIEPKSVTKQNNNLCNKIVYGSNNIPDWNKAFKDILGEKKTPTECYTSQNEVKNIETKNMNEIPQKMPFLRQKKKPIYKSKKDIEEEESINELFALSRTFKVQPSTYNLNDFDGAGINIFKTDSETSSKEHFFDSYSSLELSDASTDDFVPLKGKVAAFAKARITPSPSFEITEFWDDELWY